ncbi:ARHGEF2 [Mytilus edulis]|uniref:ARHGEF2 n=1 Tax=Mytilus edulis TaxID=6550 RepID=A0A8S3RN30_MYTED|nr:ARHGEF2 [Mytilus edulis]
MRKTNLNGLKIDKDNLNKILADKLEHILSNIEANNTTSVDSNSVRCLKCTRNWKTRAVQCTNGHWVHYSCEKLSLTEIQNLPHIDYCCKTCSKQPITVPYAITAAEALLREETIDDENCLVCNDIMTDDKQACPTCNHNSHNKCFNIHSDQCYSCHAIEEQRILSENQTQVENEAKTNKVTDHQTDVSHIDSTTLIAGKNNICNGLQQTTQTACDKVNNTPKIILSEKEQEQQNKQKELKQQELKLKKRKEQLRLKEAVVNDQSKDKTKLYDMIYKLEARNNELEKTVKVPVSQDQQ